MPGEVQGDKAVIALKCPECGVKFETQEDLEGHVQTDHPEVSAESAAAGKKSEALPAPKVRQGGGLSTGRRSLKQSAFRHQYVGCCI